MQIFVGLGNPGEKYAHTRHNIGFLALDRIAADHGFGPWKSKFQAQLAEGRLGGDKVVLLKPQTFMNLSGQAVGEAMRFYKLTTDDITVFHDELDLAPGKCRVKLGGGHAGHNGLRSIHGHIGDSYRRIRMGIGHPGRKDLVSAYVLHNFAKADEDWLEALLWGVSDGAAMLADGDTGKFQNAVALRVSPPRSSTTAKTDKSAPDAKKAGRIPTPPRTSGTASAKSTKPATKTDTQPANAPDERSAMQKLMDKFK